MAHDVFLSYSSKDKAVADAARNVLERNGVRVWMAPRDILPGVSWAAAIMRGINGARVMVLVFSSNANTSSQVEREVGRAINKRIPVVPFRVENVPPSAALEYYISTTNWLDALTPPLEQHLEYLAEAVKQLLASKYVRKRQEQADAKRRAAEKRKGKPPPVDWQPQIDKLDFHWREALGFPSKIGSPIILSASTPGGVSRTASNSSVLPSPRRRNASRHWINLCRKLRPL